MSPGVLVALAAVGLAVGMVAGPWHPRLWMAGLLAGVAASLGAAGWVLAGGGDWEWRSVVALGGERLHLRLDGVSALFLALLSVVGGVGAVYASEYWAPLRHPESASRGRTVWSGLVASMGWVLLSSNGLHFLIGWELFTVCAFFLITLDRRLGEVRAAGWLYLAASHVGTVFLFAFFGALAARTGSWDLGPMREAAGLAPLFWLALAGFGVKAGVFPLHVWLPSAHANAPSHVSAILSGVAIKMGIYGIVRFSGWLPVPVAAGWVLVGAGAVSAVLGIAFAFAQNDVKRLLAYCSVENVGIIVTGIGAALLAVREADAMWGRWVLAGALLHVWNHGIFKALLFLSAGSVLHATGTREMSALGGLWRVMPWTAGLFGIGALAVSGLPPLNGFVSEWLLYLGLFEAGMSKGASALAAMPAAILLAMAGAMALASFVKAGAMMFLGAPRTSACVGAHECGARMRGAMLLLAGLCFLVGFAPVWVWPCLMRAVAGWRPEWIAERAPEPLVAMETAQWVLGILAVAVSMGLWVKVRSNGCRRAVTWDCGYARPDERMQYTSGSFSGWVVDWFRWILRPERKSRGPAGLFPSESVWGERVPETILERVLGPVRVAVMLLSTSVRRLQHGRLQDYILYLVGGLIALGLLVTLGGPP